MQDASGKTAYQRKEVLISDFVFHDSEMLLLTL